jgi:hypothetical protein
MVTLYMLRKKKRTDHGHNGVTFHENFSTAKIYRGKRTCTLVVFIKNIDGN